MSLNSRALASAAMVLTLAACATQINPPAPAALPAATATTRPLPFKGKLVDADPDEVPPALAGAISDSSPITFHYREELQHDHDTYPLWMTGLNPGTYLGMPTGSYGVTAFATLSITEGSKVLADYTAQEHVTGKYGLYYGPTYEELEHQARDAVRRQIDDSLYKDLARLSGAIDAAKDSLTE